MTIPKRLIRTVPHNTTLEMETRWDEACELHPKWDHISRRDPINRDAFPITSKYWDECKSGAQMADLVRAEELFIRGGVFVDSDYEVFKPFDILCALDGWAAWEDEQHICNAVMGFRPGHLALATYLQLAITRLPRRTWTWDQSTWETGVGAITDVFKNRKDVLLLAPGSLYPVHWRCKAMIPRTPVREQNPWAFGVHHWHRDWSPRENESAPHNPQHRA